ncbi:hypothetical protein PMAYCL1PPCAC_17967, partial [Pristionchus mayeri]
EDPEFTDDDLNLPFFHGALMDEDMEKLLELPGDFVVVLRNKELGDGTTSQTIFLAVRTSTGNEKDAIFRTNIKKNDDGIKVLNKTFSDINKCVDWFKKEPRNIAGGQSVHLKRPINRGKWYIRHRDIQWQKRIGSGAYGQVFRCKLLPGKNIVAAKRLAGATGADELADMMKEARVMQLYDHPNIVKFYGYAVDKPPFILVMEFCNGGAVEDRLRKEKQKPIPAKVRANWLTQSAAGIEYLHKKNCIHRDIATRNCLIHEDTIKIADFGMCRATSVYKVNLAKPQNVRWLAPEVWRTGETNFRTDVYAFAVMMWEMFVIPYDTPYRAWKAIIVKRRVMEGYRMEPPPLMPDPIRKVLSLCWNHNAAERPTMGEIRKMLAEIEPSVEGYKAGSSEPDWESMSKSKSSSMPNGGTKSQT